MKTSRNSKNQKPAKERNLLAVHAHNRKGAGVMISSIYKEEKDKFIIRRDIENAINEDDDFSTEEE
jgi:hypothetical protein